MNSTIEWKIVEHMMLGDFSYVKDYNENHDPDNGQFTESPDGSSDAPKVTTPKVVAQAMRTTEDKIRNAPVEHAVCCDKDGNELFHAHSDSPTEFEFTPDEKALLKDAYFTHNHASDKTFSPEDVHMALETGARQFRACGKSGSYVLTRQYELKDQTFKQKVFDVRFSEAFKKYHKEAVEKWRAAKEKTDEYNWELRCELAEKNHQWLKDNAADYGWEYEVEKL